MSGLSESFGLYGRQVLMMCGWICLYKAKHGFIALPSTSIFYVFSFFLVV